MNVYIVKKVEDFDTSDYDVPLEPHIEFEEIISVRSDYEFAVDDAVFYKMAYGPDNPGLRENESLYIETWNCDKGEDNGNRIKVEECDDRMVQKWIAREREYEMRIRRILGEKEVE